MESRGKRKREVDATVGSANAHRCYRMPPGPRREISRGLFTVVNARFACLEEPCRAARATTRHCGAKEPDR